jgi:hypothetical protein
MNVYSIDSTPGVLLSNIICKGLRLEVFPNRIGVESIKLILLNFNQISIKKKVMINFQNYFDLIRLKVDS